MSIDEEKLIVWMDQTDKKLAHLEANQMAIINGDFCDTDTVPQEPLIKDERIRKAVRAWADVLGVERATYSDIEGEFYSGVNYIRLGQVNRLEPLKSDTYAIDELCGEEETPEPIEPKFIDLDERVKDKEK